MKLPRSLGLHCWLRQPQQSHPRGWLTHGLVGGTGVHEPDRSYAILAKRKHSVVALTVKGKNCTMHSERNIILLLAEKLTSILGVTMDDTEVSTKAKLPRNKYMRVWSWESFQMRAIRPRFPTMVMRYITRNTRNQGICHSCWYENPERTNSVSNVAFSFSISSLDVPWNKMQ